MWAGWLDGNNWNCTSTTFPPVESRGPSLAGRPALIAITRDVWCGYYRADKEVVGRGRANTPHLFLSHISTLIVCYVDEGGSYNLTQCRKSMPSLTDGRTTAGHRRDWRWGMRESEVEVWTRLNYLFFLFKRIFLAYHKGEKDQVQVTGGGSYMGATRVWLFKVSNNKRRDIRNWFRFFFLFSTQHHV
jgi:membrane-associated phospholipid phosphatase